jgi:uncharacterized RDD family membrane protein YckC
MRYAGLRQRFWALLIDFLILSALFLAVTRLVKGVWIMRADDHLWSWGWLVTDPLCIAFLIVMLGYFVILEGFTGATIGKYLLGIKVVRGDGGRAGFGSSLIRNLLRIVDALPTLNILGVVLIATSVEKARLGDRAAGTRVVVVR